MIQEWWRDGKFGMFIHWGLFSLLGGEYNGVITNHIAEWILHDLKIPLQDYESLAREFKAEKFDAEFICHLAKQAGMKYMVFTSKHHDGFAMYRSEVSRYNVFDATPFGRDPLMELKRACEKNGLEFCVYYSQAQDWDDPDGCEDGIGPETKDFEKYFRNKCIPQIKEIMIKYAPSLIWFDTPMYMTRVQSKELKDLVISIKPDCMVSGRIGNGLGDYMTSGDNFIPLLPYEYPYEVPATTNHSWGFNKFDHDWKKPEDVLRHLVKITGRGGNYLLNVGPDGDGAVPMPCIRILKKIGKFLTTNGESIYGTIPPPLYPYDIEWGLFTYRPGKLYIHVFDRKIMQFTLFNMCNKPNAAYMLKDGSLLSIKIKNFFEGGTCWTIRIPEAAPDEMDRVVCVEIEGSLKFDPIRK